MPPTVSICVPNLNTRPFLPERFASIFDQTFEDWELIVYDSYSNDGAWEYIQELAAREPRMRVSQGPREGTPLSWNPCIRQARGRYIYIATSDDTMMPEFLARMVSALEANPDCGIGQCELLIIDEEGVPFPENQQWAHYTLGAYDRNLVTKRNKRFAPHDGIVHPALFTIYTSITQLLIRRGVFEKVGYFDGQWGPMGDFEWEMRAGLVENCIYLPEKLATWRLHTSQATQDVHTVPKRMKMIEMSRMAFSRARDCGADLRRIDLEEWLYFLERDIVEMGYETGRGYRRKLRFLAEQLRRHPRAVIDFAVDKLRGKGWAPWACSNRYERLNYLLKRSLVPAPVFEP